MVEEGQPDLTALTVQLLSAYVANNTVPSNELAGLIKSTRDALQDGNAHETPAAEVFEPAVSVRKSLSSRDHLISLIDGKPYKSLKRHLGTHGLTPAEYRARYNLPADYPIVAPGYSEERRAIAHRLGLGRKKGEAPAVPPAGAVAAAGSAREAETTASAPAETKPVAPAPRRRKPAKAAGKPEAGLKVTAAAERSPDGKKPGTRTRKPKAETQAKPASAPAQSATKPRAQRKRATQPKTVEADAVAS